jgi:copper chaperone
MAKQVLAVTGMHCASCGMLVDDALEELAGVTSSSTNVRRGRTKVDYDPALTTLTEITKVVTKLGYQVERVPG